MASGYASKAFGAATTASGSYASSFGAANTASGDYSTALGYGNTAGSHSETVLGSYAANATGNPTDWIDTDRLFSVGNGTEANRSNALTLFKDGRLALQSDAYPDYALQLPNDAGNNGVGRARAVEWTTYSGGRLKSPKTALPYGLNEILQFEPLTYFHHSSEEKDGRLVIKESGKQQIGFVAQDMHKIIPEIVGIPEDEAKGLWGISYDKLTPVLVKAIQEQQQLIENLKTENKTLKDKHADVERQFAQQQEKIDTMEKAQQQWMAKMEQLTAGYAVNEEKGSKKAEE